METIEHSSLLDVKEGIICHQANCVGIMGAGIALQIREKWPDVFKQYASLCKIFKNNPAALLGKVQDIAISEKLVVANCFWQIYAGPGLMTCYESWKLIVKHLLDVSSYFNGLSIHFPYKVGCGLAGGDWNILSKILEDGFKEHNIDVFVHKI